MDNGRDSGQTDGCRRDVPPERLYWGRGGRAGWFILFQFGIGVSRPVRGNGGGSGALCELPCC